MTHRVGENTRCSGPTPKGSILGSIFGVLDPEVQDPGTKNSSDQLGDPDGEHPDPCSIYVVTNDPSKGHTVGERT